jgi:hypothetical protein
MKGMNDKRTTGAWMAVALMVALMVLLPSISYVVGYFLRSQVLAATGRQGSLITRIYPTDWEATIFKPAAKIESLVTGKDVSSVKQIGPYFELKR